MLGKIINIPIIKQQTSSSRSAASTDTILERIKQLSWDDPESFFNLEANCFSGRPIEMNDRVREKLERLDLINDSGHSPLLVRIIMHSITENICETTVIA